MWSTTQRMRSVISHFLDRCWSSTWNTSTNAWKRFRTKMRSTFPSTVMPSSSSGFSTTSSPWKSSRKNSRAAMSWTRLEVAADGNFQFKNVSLKAPRGSQPSSSTTGPSLTLKTPLPSWSLPTSSRSIGLSKSAWTSLLSTSKKFQKSKSTWAALILK